MRLIAVPVDLAEAKTFVEANHRSHKAPAGGKFAIAVAQPGITITPLEG